MKIAVEISKSAVYYLVFLENLRTILNDDPVSAQSSVFSVFAGTSFHPTYLLSVSQMGSPH